MLAIIEAEWAKYPDMRLGQLLYFLLGNHMGDLFYVEDGQWLYNIAQRATTEAQLLSKDNLFVSHKSSVSFK